MLNSISLFLFTTNSSSMKKNYFNYSLILLSIALFFTPVINAQSTINVSVLNDVFSPANFTINVGDTVRWTNNAGIHNVNGTTSTFPSNPESFGNPLNSNWTFSHKFLTAGNYNYRCDNHFTTGMTGAINVQALSEISENELDIVQVTIFPNPTSDFIHISISDKLKITDYELFDMLGNLVYEGSITSEITVSDLQKGIYFLKLYGNNISLTERVILN